MVKGVSRRVIVVNTPDPRLFEQAIFILKETAFHRSGVSAEDILDEARRVADGYVLRNAVLGRRARQRFPRVTQGLLVLLGAALASGVWSICLFWA